MALAILESIDADDSTLRFRIDTGTNTHYQLKVGRDVREDDGDEWVDDVYYTGPLQQNDSAGDLFDTAREISLPVRVLERGKSFVQLVTFKAGGRAQAFSDVLPLSGAPMIAADVRHKPARRVSNRTAPLATQASLESLLGEVVKIASPIVLDLLKNAAGGAAGTGATGTPGGSSAGTSTAAAPTDILGQVLKSLLAALSAPAQGTTVSHQSSLATVLAEDDNRFAGDGSARYAHPLIFGVDDALIAAVAGPIIQVLPQLLNAANQKRIELKKADNQLVGGILSDINKRMLMDKVLEAQKAAQAQGPAAPINPDQLKALADLLAALPASAPATSTPASLTSAPLSLRDDAGGSHALSNRAMLAFAFGPAVEWNGAAKPVFDRTRRLVLKPRLAVAPPAPNAPLPKAIVKVVLQDDRNPMVRAEKVFKLKNVLANSPIECAFEPGELAHLPPNICLTVLAELRWRNGRTGRETRALGSAELVLVSTYFVKATGPEVSAERELTDMARFRPFWNKVWEAPVLDGARGATGDKKKYFWALDVNAKYSTVLSASHDSNGFMETKILREPDDAESMTLGVRGRMKAGIELSVAELNKLIPLWGGTMLDAPKLDAFAARPFLDNAARELKYAFKLKGRAGEAGMIWVVPVFKLFGVTLSAIAAADDTGQVTATSETQLQFPLPVAARLIGLKSAA